MYSLYISFLYIHSVLVVSKIEETIANELRDILQEASLNRPQIKSRPLPKSRSTSPPQSGTTRYLSVKLTRPHPPQLQK